MAQAPAPPAASEAAGPFASLLAAQGEHAIVLPPKLAAGKRATLAVVNADGKLAAGVRVEFGGGVTLTTDETGRASFTAPEEPGVVTVRLADGAQATATVMRVSEHPADELILDDVPTMVAIGSRFTVNGYGFRGEADENVVTVGDQPAVVLAASSMVLVLAPHPESKPGPAEFRIETGAGTAVTFSTTVVRLEVSADKPQLAPKEKGRLTVRAQGTLTRVEIEARNLTPEIVRLRQGVVQRVTTKGGIENTATLRLEGRAQGEYQIAVRLMPPPMGLPDTERALRSLIRAIPFAPNDEMRERILRQVHRLEAHPHDLPRVRDALEVILSEHSAGDFGRHVEAAWKALLKR
jgi:hypothetical protein